VSISSLIFTGRYSISTCSSLSRYKVGDHIMYKDPTVTIKSEPKYLGPFRIKQVMPDNAYILEDKTHEFLAPANFLKSTKLRLDEELFDAELDAQEEDYSEVGRDSLRDKSYKPSSSTESVTRQDETTQEPSTYSARHGTRIKKPNPRYTPEL
jgi:hypothetical protein